MKDGANNTKSYNNIDTDSIDIIANFFSKSAIDKISKAGGSYQINKK